MSDAMERLAEAIVFEHEDRSAVAAVERDVGGAEAAEVVALRDAANLATAAFAAKAGAMPSALATRLAFAGRAFCAAREAQRGETSRSPAPREPREPRAASESRAPIAAAVPASSRAPIPWLPFLLGAAAGVAAMLLFGRAGAIDPSRADVLAQGGSRWEWQQGPSQVHGAVHGDVVWDQERQLGFLRIEGLEPLPEGQQYQLWIVDKTREVHPVDGGVFDLAKKGEQIVPVRPRLPVREPGAFVVTVEPQGGVVVSKQHDVVAIAKAD